VEVSFAEIVADTLAQDRPRLPAPHQVAVELWNTTWVEEVHGRRGIVNTGTLSNRSLIYHGWVTLSATLLGFGIGTGLGILLAIGIVHNRAMDQSVMPWAIASQTIPILAIAPMVIVVLASVGITGLLPKAVISAYLSFFPVVVGMVKGLRSPDGMQLDLLRTYNASPMATLWKLRLPASMPYLFASLKVSMAASLVGAIVGELPAGATSGLGARLLSGSYYGQTIQIWAALFAAAILAAGLVIIIGGVERATLRRMGMGQ
jgi:NitT/TauT family transport system permease protein